MDFGVKLKMYRERNHLTQTQLAKLTGVARSKISALENVNKHLLKLLIQKFQIGLMLMITLKLKCLKGLKL